MKNDIKKKKCDDPDCPCHWKQTKGSFEIKNNEGVV